MEHMKQALKESKIKKVICILGCILVALVIFQAGKFVGFEQAGFSFMTGEQYFRQMNGNPDNQFMGMNRGDFENSHGSAGKIVSINLPAIIVSDKDAIEKTIIISTSTDIKQFKDSIKAEDLKINDFIIAIGNPNNNAEVEAKLIRVMPDPANMPLRQIGTGTPVNK
jgi:hypothetical protein